MRKSALATSVFQATPYLVEHVKVVLDILNRTVVGQLVFSSVLPVHNYTPQSQEAFARRPLEKVLELNAWIKNYCESNGCIYLDYFSVMVDDKGLLKRDLAEDGLHPNPAGYKVMAPLAEAPSKRL